MESAGSLTVTLKVSGKRVFHSFTVYVTAYVTNATDFPAKGSHVITIV